MSDEVVRKRGRPKKVVAEAARKDDGSDNVPKGAATLDGTLPSTGTAAPKKALPQSSRKGSVASKGSKENVAVKPEPNTTTGKKGKITKKTTPETIASGGQGGIKPAKMLTSDTKTKPKRKKAEPKVEEPSTATSTPTGTRTSKSKILDEVAEKQISAKGSESTRASSTPGETAKAASEGDATSSSSNPSKPAIPSSKILDELARQKITSESGKSASISSQKQDISNSERFQQPKNSASASAITSASKSRPSNPLPPPRKSPTVLGAQQLKEFNSRRGNTESKTVDIRATREYKKFARKYDIFANFRLFNSGYSLTSNPDGFQQLSPSRSYSTPAMSYTNEVWNLSFYIQTTTPLFPCHPQRSISIHELKASEDESNTNSSLLFDQESLERKEKDLLSGTLPRHPSPQLQNRKHRRQMDPRNLSSHVSLYINQYIPCAPKQWPAFSPFLSPSKLFLRVHDWCFICSLFIPNFFTFDSLFLVNLNSLYALLSGVCYVQNKFLRCLFPFGIYIERVTCARYFCFVWSSIWDRFLQLRLCSMCLSTMV